MDVFICDRGIAVSIDKFVELFGNEEFLKLKKKLIITSIDRITKIPKKTTMFNVVRTQGGSIIEIPRFYLDTLVSKNYIKNIRSYLSDGEIINCDYIGKSNPNQQVVVSHVMNILNTPKSLFEGITLKQGAGTGKSFSAMDIINHVKRKTLIVVPNTYLLDQWVKLLTEYFPTSTIGVLYGKKKKDGDIIVSIINTVADLKEFEVSQKLPWPNVGKTLKYMKQTTTTSVDKLLSKIGLTIFDESQMYVSKEFRKVFQRIHSKYTIGLSATPDIREDKLDRIHTSWIGPIIDADELENYSPAQDAFQSKATLIKYHAHDDHTTFKIRDDGLMDYQSILETLVNDPNRNNLIVDQIIRLAKKGHFVFVFSDRRNHLEYLYDLVCTQTFNSTINIEMPEANKKIILYGGSSEETIENANNISNIIFTTYQYSSTGVSIKKMDCLILTTPRRSNMKQIINRIFRLGSDQTIERQIIDIIDMKMPIKNQFRERVKAYTERGSNIVSIDHIV
jgi:superfamily II DNA or RNA helicase